MLRETSIGQVFLKIGLLVPEFSLTHILSSQQDFQNVVVENKSSTVIESLSKSFLQTSSMRDIDNLDWPNNLSEYSYLKDSPVVSIEEIKDLLYKEAGEDADFSEKAVHVEYIDMRWFYKDRKNFISFVTLLQEMPGSFFTSKFTKAILDQYWDESQKKIMWY